MKTYKKKNGKVIVTEIKIDEIKELEVENKLLEETYDSEFNDDYFSITAKKLG